MSAAVDTVDKDWPIKHSGHRLSSLCFLILIVLAFAYGMYQVFSDNLAKGGIGAWLDGTAEKQLDDKLVLPGYGQFQTLDAAWRYRVLGHLGSQVQQGCPGWLFYTDGLKSPLANPESVLEQRVRLMKSLAARLESTRVRLLVVTVPDKSRVLNDRLCGLHRSVGTQNILPRWHRAVEAQGIPYVSLLESLATVSDPYYRTDVHMTQQGAAQAAQAVAAYVKSLVGDSGETDYEISRASRPEQRIGDLLSLAGLADAPEGWRPVPDVYTPEIFALASSGGLLADDPPLKILLAGSSNSRRSNFAEQLSHDLKQPVWNVSRDGGKFADTLSATLRDRDSWPESLELVIWEMSEMSLYTPLTEEEKAALDAL
ncbi:alginate O-acetyltransferase AlgX-related protein [Castellaniella sp.]|uniref:alginate O-acetyltransferase AlgX-related protein n=1 Tax=Castellaniella sp. TaxID=1955812 RepID=UPI002AFF0381|nr:cell division protein FtsQ [Castellaniella sp.]